MWEGGADAERSQVQNWVGGLLWSPYQLANKHGEGGKAWDSVWASAGRKSGNPPVSVWLSALETARLEYASSMPVDLYIVFVVKKVVLVWFFNNKK